MLLFIFTTADNIQPHVLPLCGLQAATRYCYSLLQAITQTYTPLLRMTTGWQHRQDNVLASGLVLTEGTVDLTWNDIAVAFVVDLT